MATSYTSRARLEMPAVSDRNWDGPLNRNTARLDALAPVGGLCVAAAESPSTSLGVTVGAGDFVRADGSVASYGGTGSAYALPASAATRLWLDDSGALASGTSWPSAAHVRLATAVTGGSTVTSVVDARVALAVVGGGEVVAVVTATSAYTLADGVGEVRADASGGAFAVTLPAATARPGRVVRVRNVGPSGVVTVGSSSPINGSSTSSLSTQWAGKTYVADGATNTWGCY